MNLAEVLFEQYFQELYSQGNDNIGKEAFILYVQEKLPSNEKLAKTFIEQFEEIDQNKDGNLSADEVIQCLAEILRCQHTEQILLRDQHDQNFDNIFDEHCRASEEKIGKIIEDFKMNQRDEHCNFGEEFENLIDLIGDDSDIKKPSTLIRGDQLV